MGGFSMIHWIVVILVVVLLFGAGRVSNLMGDVAKGIKSFKKGMSDEDEPAEPARRIASEQSLDARPIPATPPAEPAVPVATPAPPVATPDPDRQA